MANNFHSFRNLIGSLMMFGAFVLAIAMTAYQIFSPDGHVFLWLMDLWNTSPLLLILLGAALLLLKHLMDGYAPEKKIANSLVFLIALAGIVAGINWLT